MRRIAIAFALVLAAASTSSAQDPRVVTSPTFETKTVELRYLTAQQARALLMPYVINGAGGVFMVDDSKQLLTLRDVSPGVARMESVLAKYDRMPATIRLTFQLIEADTGKPSGATFSTITGERLPPQIDPAIEASLRSVLRFTSYRVVATAIGTTREGYTLSQKIAPADTLTMYTVFAGVGRIRVEAPALGSPRANVPSEQLDLKLAIFEGKATINLNRVGLVRDRMMVRMKSGNEFEIPSENIIDTGLDVALGTTVVLGTAAKRGSVAALILTVKTELVAPGGK